MRGVQRGEHEELVEGRKGRSERLTGIGCQPTLSCLLGQGEKGKEKKRATIKKEEEMFGGQTAFVAVACPGFPCHFYSDR